MSVSDRQRLQKVLAAAGYGSRRACEELITEGRVEVDRKVVQELGVQVDPETQKIRVDGQAVKIARKQYFIVNKPTGVLSTSFDPSGRMRVIDLVNTDQRIFTVGRLDRTSEGLILVTNDGTLAQKLTHPSYGIEKRYMISTHGNVSREEMDELKNGVHLSDGFAQIHDYRIKKKTKRGSEVEIVLKEGKNREIRRLLAKIGHKVLRLKRIAIGPVLLGDLKAGDHRRLDGDEVVELKNFVESRKPKKKVVTKQHKRLGASDLAKRVSKRKGKKFSKKKGVRTAQSSKGPKGSKAAGGGRNSKAASRKSSSTSRSSSSARPKKSSNARGSTSFGAKKKRAAGGAPGKRKSSSSPKSKRSRR